MKMERHPIFMGWKIYSRFRCSFYPKGSADSLLSSSKSSRHLKKQKRSVLPPWGSFLWCLVDESSFSRKTVWWDKQDMFIVDSYKSAFFFALATTKSPCRLGGVLSPHRALVSSFGKNATLVCTVMRLHGVISGTYQAFKKCGLGSTTENLKLHPKSRDIREGFILIPSNLGHVRFPGWVSIPRWARQLCGFCS